VQTNLAEFIKHTHEGAEAAQILGKCVHCGFCTATCPTYQLLGDELDGPRGRIYLIKQVLEGETPTGKTQLHLDRCLTCRNCETTCPSGVQYGRLLDIGRKVVDDQVGRSAGQSLMRTALKEGLPSPLFAPAMRLGQLMRPLLPATLKKKVPAKQDAGSWPRRTHVRKMLMLSGCVQPAMLPNINAATARVFDALGIELVVPNGAGCCGAIRYHLNDHDGGLADARRNIDVWWPHIEAGCEAIVMNASGCGAQVREYGHMLRFDPAYAKKAQRVSELTKDVAELLPAFSAEILRRLKPQPSPASAGEGGAKRRVRGNETSQRIVFHPPCTLQHGQQIRGTVEAFLALLGVEVLPFSESHLCCGSAGTYSILQSELSMQLRDRKLANLQQPKPDKILSANIGCITHLQSGTERPVMHWIEWLDARLAAV
jgi:glycolate oxidase iron-sulfur subunit